VRKADKFISDNRELLENYFDNPCPTGILVLTVSNWDSRTKLSKKLPKVGRLISVTQPKAGQLPDRLVRYASDAHSKNLTSDAAELVMELTGDDLTRLYSEVDKLAVFADEAKSITTEHVELLIGHNRLFNAFGVIDAVADGDVGEAISRLRGMFAADKSAEYTAVGAFAFHFRRMFSAKVLLEEGVRPKQVADKLRIWSNKDRFFGQLQTMSLKQIGDVLEQLAEMDYAIKTGRTRTEVAIEQLVLRLSACRSKAKG
jgi:DNA polymerase-3 subunit delta